MDERVAVRSVGPTPGWVPWAVILLLLGAAISLVVQLLPDWYQILGPYLIVDADLVVRAFVAIAVFVLPAAVLAGSGRWTAGRRWLWWGAAALSVAAVIDVVREAWFAAFAASPSANPLDAQGVWVALWLSGVAAMVAGHALLAMGLWSGAGGLASVATLPPVIRAAAVLVALLTVAAFVASAWAAFVIPWNGIEPAVLATGGGLLLATGYGLLGVVAIAALRSMPPAAALPEALIAAGATVAMLSGAGHWMLPYLFLGTVPEFVGGIFVVLAALSAAGLLVMAAGFALGMRAAPQRPVLAEPA